MSAYRHELAQLGDNPLLNPHSRELQPWVYLYKVRKQQIQQRNK